MNLLVRLALPVALPLAALAGLAAPAAAQTGPDIPAIGVEVPEQVTVVEGRTAWVTATVVNAGRTTAQGVVLRFGEADPSLGRTLPEGCDAGGCDVPALAPGARVAYRFALAPAPAATVGDVASAFAVSVGGANGAVLDAARVTVVRAAGHADLELAGIDDVAVEPGNYTQVPITFRNSSAVTLDHLAVVIVAEQGLEPLAAYVNCDFDRQADFTFTAVTCLVDQRLAPGATYTVPATTNPILVKVAADAGGPYAYAVTAAVVGVSDTVTGSLAGRSGPTLSMRRTAAPDDIDSGDNAASFGVTVSASAADLGVTGGELSGTSGDTLSFTVAIVNAGPAATVPPGTGRLPTARVTLPAVITVTKAGDNCIPTADLRSGHLEAFGKAGARDYTCVTTQRMRPALTTPIAGFAFTATVMDGPHTDGKVVLDRGGQDPDAADTFALTWHVPTGTSGGELPVTGAAAGRAALGAAALVAAGAVAFLIARRGWRAQRGISPGKSPARPS